MQLTETITWHPAAEPPDCDITVLVFNTESVEAGFYEGNRQWRYCESGGLADGITHWADMPGGPKA